MNRAEFMRQLESLLQNISQVEREEALQYYNEYFNDAGEENEQQVIEALGNPAKVAENIKRELFGSSCGAGGAAERSGREVSTVRSFGNQFGRDGAWTGNSSQQTSQTQTGSQSTVDAYGNEHPSSGKGMSGGMIALIVVLSIFAAPLLVSVAGVIAGVLLSLILGWFGLIFGFGLSAVLLFVMMLLMVVLGIGGIVVSPLGACGVIGAGLLCGGIGLLFLMLTVAMAGIATPAIVSGLVSLTRKLFKRQRNA